MPGGEPGDSGRGLVAGPHHELVLLAEPALDGLGQLVLEIPADVQERGRARAGVQVLIGAADRQVGAAAVQVHRDRPRRVAHIPQHQRPRLVREAGDGGQVGQRPAPVGHVRQADQRGVRPDGGADVVRPDALVRVGADHAQLAAGPGGDTRQHVAVGGEVVVVGDQDRPARPGVQGRAGQLVQVHRGGVAHHHLARARAQQVLAEQVAYLPGQIHPVRPGPDQPGAPLLADHLGYALRGRGRQPAQRVAVQVDQAGLEGREPVLEGGERIRRVQVRGPGPERARARHWLGPRRGPRWLGRVLAGPVLAGSAPGGGRVRRGMRGGGGAGRGTARRPRAGRPPAAPPA